MAASERSAWVIQGNTAQILRGKAPGVVEHYEARNEGVAVTWVLKERLANKGPLQIQAELSGLRHAAQSEHGHHFSDEEGVARVRIGKVTAVDSAGQSWELATTFSQAKLHVEVPETVLGSAAYPLAIDPVIGPEFGINQPIEAPVQGTMPAVASNGRDYLLAWKLTVRLSSDDYAEQIRAVRISRDGSILDPAGILVVNERSSVNFPSLASDGDGFLVTWADSRQWDHGNDWTLQIYGARISPAGQVLDPEGIWLSHGTPGTGYRSAVAGNTNGYLVAWEDLRNAGTNTMGVFDIYGSRVTSSGSILDYAGIPLCTASNNQTAPAIAALDNRFLVVWTDTRGKTYDPYVRTDYTAIWGAVVGSDGSAQQPNGFLINDGPWNQDLPTVAASDNGFFVAWEDDRNASGPPWPGNSDIFGTRVSSAGAVLDPSAFPLTTAAGTQSGPAAAFDGTAWFVAWEDGRNATASAGKWDISAARIDQDGIVVSPENWVVATNTSSSPSPAVAKNGTDLLVAWNADREIFRPFATGIMGARVRTGGVLDAEPRILSIQGRSETLPVVAWNGSTYLLAWMLNHPRSLDSSTRILGARVSPAGSLLEPNGIAIATLPNAEHLNPSVAANGQDFFVAWQDGRNGPRDIYGTLISSGGQVSSSNGTAICTAAYNQYSPLVAASGSQFLVTWMDFRNGQGANVAADVYGARVNGSGVVLDPNGFPISTADRDQYPAAVAGNESHWLVTWTDSRLTTNWPWISQVIGARVNSAGQVLEPDGLIIDPTPKSIQSIGVAAHGSEFYVAWMEQPNSDDFVPVKGSRVTDGGAVVNPGGVLVGDACCESFQVGVTETADGYLVTWHSVDLLTNEQAEEEDYPLPSDLRGVRVRTDGTLRDLLPLYLTPSTELLAPARIAGSGNEFLMVYSAKAPVDRLQARAARLNLGLPSPWNEHSISAGAEEGSAAFSVRGVSVVGVGQGIGGRSDDFYFLHQTLAGDGQLTARFNQWLSHAPNAEAGIMLRDNVAASSREVFLGLNMQGQTVFERRKNPNARAWVLRRAAITPKWMRLVRQGNAISAWISPDGHNWSFVWIARVNMSSSVEAGLAISPGETNNPAGALFDHVEVAALSPSPVSLAPAGGTAAIQMGSPVSGLALDDENGAQLLVYGAAGTTTVLEGSTDLQIWTELVRFNLTEMPMDYEEDLLPKRFYRARQVSP